MSGEHTHPEVDLLTARVAALESALLDSPRLEYAYLGKPSGTLLVGRTYVRLDLSTFTPAGPGWEHTLRYLNIAPSFRAGKVAGAIRPRLVRADGDTTDFDDIVIHADACDDDGVTLRTHTYWEAGDGGETYLQLKCIGGLDHALISTRYTKKAVLRRV